MEMITVSSQNVTLVQENKPGKKEVAAGEFESVLKSIIPNKENKEKENKEKAVELSAYIFTGQSMPLLEKEWSPEVELTETASLKAPSDSLGETGIKLETTTKEILKELGIVEENVNKEIPKERPEKMPIEIPKETPKQVMVKGGFTEEMISQAKIERQGLHKAKEGSNQNIQANEQGKEKIAQVFSAQNKDSQTLQKTAPSSQSIEKGLESNFKNSPNLEKINTEKPALEKNNEAAFFNLEKTETAFKVETQRPEIKSSQDNITRVEDAIVKLFETSSQGQRSSMKVSLHPESLGKVDIGLKMENGKLTASILVENDQVRELFANKLGQLDQSLAKQDLVIDKIQIQVKNAGENLQMDMNHQGSFNQQGKRQGQRRINNIFKSEYKDFKEIQSISLEKGVSILA